MFSGLIREIGKISSLVGNRLEVLCAYQPRIGDSIAVNGVCLTAIESSPRGFVAELSDTTKSLIALEKFASNAPVHIEPALRADSRLDGHIVQGHIDAIGVIEHITHLPTQSNFFITTSTQSLCAILPKGSISVDGVSLTVVDVAQNGFWLTIIPHTLQNTLFKTYTLAQRVNLETDMFVRNTLAVLKHFDMRGNSGYSRTSWADVDCIQLAF